MKTRSNHIIAQYFTTNFKPEKKKKNNNNSNMTNILTRLYDREDNNSVPVCHVFLT